MYEIKEVKLQQGNHERRRLVIEFTNHKQAILGEFLMTDAPLLSWNLLQQIEDVLHGKLKVLEGSGNRTSWDINEEVARIDDLFTDMADDIPIMATCTIETRKLYELIKMWYEEIKQFNHG